MTRRPLLTVAPCRDGLCVLVTDDWQKREWPKPGEVLDPFQLRYLARKAAAKGGVLTLAIMADGVENSLRSPNDAERDAFYEGGSDAP